MCMPPLNLKIKGSKRNLKQCAYDRITEWFWLEWYSYLNPLLKQGHLEHVAQDCVQMAFEDLKQGICTAFLGIPFQCSATHTVKRFLMFRLNLLCFSLRPLTCPHTWHYWRTWLHALQTLSSDIYVHW